MPNSAATEQVQALPQGLCKETVAEWNDTAGDYVRAKMFDRKQFVTDGDLEMGGHIQKLVAMELHISGAERQRQFWEEHGGRATVRNTVRKKRQAAQNSMKLAFRGELVYCCVTRMNQNPSFSITNIFFAVNTLIDAEIEWIAKTNKDRKVDPPKPEELIGDTGLRSDVAQYTEFSDRMKRAVYGKTRYSPSSSTTFFDDLISPSQEAFALLLYKNGYENWVWMHNHACLTSDGSDATVGGEGEDEEGCPRYKYTKRAGDFTSRNGGWTRDGMNLYNELYKKVKEDRQTDDGAFGKVYREHRACLGGKKRKRSNTDGAGQQHQLAICDDLEQLWTAAASETARV
jgi:hypothetical protein